MWRELWPRDLEAPGCADVLGNYGAQERVGNSRDGQMLNPFST